MSARPRKPWRVVLNNPTGQSPEAEFTSEAKTYEYVRAELQKAEAGETKTTAIRINQWSDGRWWHFETVNPGERS
ncbi:hypothetical protein [Streptomyces noursei]|uniref:hypothetical protein n=1 Tax=Streptomyces noursei TaxID=1971 RepID=UPI00167A3A7C|nr:hypothetical protein [Streptomyces noursei]MCZ1014003.1 hypothetical protein [Streptomyces noursei]GGX49109.1 hypothetical protein GCM10010341_83430 [Streptomyces noursei]